MDGVAAIENNWSDRAEEMLDFLINISDNPALDNETVLSWYRTGIIYWGALIWQHETFISVSFGRMEKTAYDHAKEETNNALYAYRRAHCDLWQLQDYSDADEVCAESER